MLNKIFACVRATLERLEAAQAERSRRAVRQRLTMDDGVRKGLLPLVLVRL